MTEKHFRKVVTFKSFTGDAMVEEKDYDEWALVLTAIPVVGTLMILLYISIRAKDEHCVEIKRKPR